jgi:hypothetical protein
MQNDGSNSGKSKARKPEPDTQQRARPGTTVNIQQQAKDLSGKMVGVKAGQISTVSGDIIFQLFAHAPTLSKHIRVREFQTLVAERTRKFVGRSFVFNAIAALLTDSAFPSGYIVLSGEPGIGKTALVAQWVKQRGCVHHFNIAAQNIRSVSDFLTNVCAQLIVRYELDHLTVPPEATKDSGFLSQLLAEAAEKQGVHPIVIAVDALDEVEDLGSPAGENRLYLPPSLPDGVYFIVTKREEYDDRLFVDRRKDIYLRDDDPRNLEDVHQYIRGFIEDQRAVMTSQIKHWSVTEAQFVETIAERSEGNFMYLVHVLNDICAGQLTAANVGDIRKLPHGLHAYYQRHWRAMKARNVERFEKYYQPVVCILATVREPVTAAQVEEWTKLTPAQVKTVIAEWREFLNVDESGAAPLYRIYHASFQDFLKEEVGLTRYHDRIAVSALRKIPGFLDGGSKQ